MYLGGLSTLVECLWARPGACPRMEHERCNIPQSNLIFFMTYKWTQYAGVLHYSRVERLARDKHSNLLAPFVNYEENEVF